MNRHKAIEWVVGEHTGRSSLAMWYALMSDKPRIEDKWCLDIPQDPSDFNRCLNFVSQCDVNLSDLQRVAEVFPYWEPIIENWYRLAQMFYNDAFQNLYWHLKMLKVKSDKIKNGGLQSSAEQAQTTNTF